jgi:hypothetical protein
MFWQSVLQYAELRYQMIDSIFQGIKFLRDIVIEMLFNVENK